MLRTTLNTELKAQFASDGEFLTREVIVKKSFIIMLLTSMQFGCSLQQPLQGDDYALLSFAELATEITVAYEEHDSASTIKSNPGVLKGSP